jgi:hypothetical protein
MMESNIDRGNINSPKKPKRLKLRCDNCKIKFYGMSKTQRYCDKCSMWIGWFLYNSQSNYYNTDINNVTHTNNNQ